MAVSLLAVADPTRCCAAASDAAVRVTNVDPGDSPDAEAGAYPYGTAVIDDIVYFSLADAAHGRELWRSDGTTAGTWMVADLDPGPLSSSPDALTAIDGVLYFGAADQEHGCRLWRSDGTAEGTQPLAAFQSSGFGCHTASGEYIGPSQFTAVGSTVFFAGRTAVHGEELWRTDGSAAGTQLVRDIGPASEQTDGSGAPRGLAAVGGQLLFAADDGVHGRELWRSDGTAAGTMLVRDVAPGPTAGLGFTTALSTVHGVAVFPATDGASGYEPWRSDGTEAGTTRLADLSPQAFSSMLEPGPRTTPTIAIGDDVYLWAFGGDPGEFGVWRTDGTSAPELVGGLPPPGGIVVPPTVVGSAAYFAWSAPEGAGLWRVDAAGTTLARVISGAPLRPQIGGFLAVDDVLAFLAQDDVHGCALWRSDGSPAGTRVVADVNADRTECNESTGLWTARAVEHVMFEGNDGQTGTEVWALPVEAIRRAPSCAGDCNGDGQVTVDELVRGVGIALGTTPLSTCASVDRDGDGAVSIAELIEAVTAALAGC
jgi:ELWxxDGT repeat protein